MGDAGAETAASTPPPLCLFGYATLYRICPCAVGDAPRTVCRQTCTHSRFELLPITSHHSGNCRTNRRSQHGCRPKVFEIGKRSLHLDFPRFNAVEPRIRPQVLKG